MLGMLSALSVALENQDAFVRADIGLPTLLEDRVQDDFSDILFAQSPNIYKGAAYRALFHG